MRHCGEKRKRDAAKRWKEHPSEEFWKDVIWKLNQSEFCNGNNDRGWIADFDFLVKSETAHRAIEGKYDFQNKTQPKQKLSLLEKLELMKKGEKHEQKPPL